MRNRCAGSAACTTESATSGEGDVAATAKFAWEINRIFAASWEIICFIAELSPPLLDYRGGKMSGYGVDLWVVMLLLLEREERGGCCYR